MKKLKRYAIQRTYIKNGVKMQELKNLATGSTIYRRKDEVSRWAKRPEFEILLQATPSNVKSVLKQLNSKLADYKKLGVDTKIYQNFLSQVTAVVGAENVTKGKRISLGEKSVSDIIQRIEGGGYRFDIERLKKFPTITQLLKKDKIPTASGGFDIPKAKRLEILSKYENYKLNRDFLWHEFFDWWYDIIYKKDEKSKRLKAEWYDLYEMLTLNPQRKTQYDVFTRYEEWVAKVRR